ncbi:MAG: alkaline phosphatase family protein, partial [Calditrichaeota bacterium]
MKRVMIYLGIVALSTLIFLTRAGSGSSSSYASPPRMVVLLVVDQLQETQLSSLAPNFRHGFARLLNQGAVFTNAHHDHAYTVTAAGHATIATGTHPSHHGIVGNAWWDPHTRKWIGCVTDPEHNIVGKPDAKGRSPHFLQRSTLGDWLKQAYPDAKVMSVSIKDRGSILPAGYHPDGAYWFDYKTGEFVTSTYYRKDYPAWVTEFNHRRLPDTYADSQWAPISSDFSGKPPWREDASPYESDGIHTTFPHAFGDAPGNRHPEFYSEFACSPFGDQYTLAFARRMIEAEALGADETPDLLCISLSATDKIGHRYGPYSREMYDHLLRLDRYLGEFLDFLDRRIGAGNYLVVLSSDHGALPVPEELQKRGVDARRVPVEVLQKAIDSVAAEVTAKLHLPEKPFLKIVNNGLAVVLSSQAEQAVPRSRVLKALAEALRELPLIEDTFTPEELLSGDTPPRPFLEAFRHSYFPQRSPNILVRLKAHVLIVWDRIATSHGSPYAYDTHVPLIFSGPGISPDRHEQRV